ncbi:MAG: DUF3343 domain-containing protein [Clostridia bacterium]|nr:DUF3343 domain-containing protein [Clostridia bacterium]
MNTLIAFSSRSEAVRLLNALKSQRIVATLINTPRYLHLSCGLSVVFPSSHKSEVLNTVSDLNLKTSLGIYTR